MIHRPNNLTYKNVILSEANYGGLPKALLMLGETNGTAAIDEMTLAAGTSHTASYGGGVTLGNTDTPFNRSNLRSALFNGSTGYCLLTDAADLRFTNNFTLEFWFKPPTAQTGTYALCNYTDTNGQQTAVLYGFIAGKVEFFAVGQSGSDARTGSGMTVTPATWNHVVYAYDGSTFAGYVNGTQIFSSARSFSLYTGTRRGWYVGCALPSTNSLNAYFTGVALYNYALAADRIMYHYLAGKNGIRR